MAKARIVKIPDSNSVIDELQNAMCSLIYKTLVEKMIGMQTTNTIVPFDTYKIHLSVYGSEQILYFACRDSAGKNVSSTNELNFKHTTLKDPIFSWIAGNTNFPKKVEAYDCWINAVTKSIEELIVLEREYDVLLNKIYDLPLFSVGRFVIIEKYKPTWAKKT